MRKREEGLEYQLRVSGLLAGRERKQADGPRCGEYELTGERTESVQAGSGGGNRTAPGLDWRFILNVAVETSLSVPF